MKKRKTRREEFLERMDCLIPWERLEEWTRPHYFRGHIIESYFARAYLSFLVGVFSVDVREYKGSLTQKGDLMEFIYQPREGNRLGDFIIHNLSCPWDRFRVAVAFVKQSGTKHIEEALASFANERDVEIIVGIDHRGTSLEGLQSLLDAVSASGRVMVFHNRGFLTFHPKIFLFHTDRAAELIVGSGNLTEGGLFGNYEAGIRLSLDLTDPDQFNVFQSIDDILNRWSDEATGIVSLLDDELLSKLVEQGLVPSEDVPASDSGERETREPGGSPDWGQLPFVSRNEPRAPRVRGTEESAEDSVTEVVVGEALTLWGDNFTPAGYVMTLQQTDVGTGQTTPGTAARSPEIFIPLGARNMHPAFWRWPDGFVNDPNIQGKRDRFDVRVRLGGEVITVSFTYFPHRHEFRLRSTELRAAGSVGDILRVELMPNNEEVGYEYYVEVVPQGTTNHETYRGMCVTQVRNSAKRYGYY